ncbi:MAG: alpha/beta hydrolase [Clostridia bacterium]|nr:alpha/beta hydrolase [Clostridia bacterium]
MPKYNINKEFFPYSRIAPPIRNAKIAGWMGSKMKPPRWINTDHEVAITKESIKSYDGADISVFVFDPYGLEERSPCLVYYHGGGFFFEGAGYHYKLAKRYALEAECRVVFVQYRLAPKHPHPTPAEDCYASLRWTFENAERLNIDKNMIAVGGDSAGGALAAAVCQMARDRGTDTPIFQLLVYPVTDRRMDNASCRNYTDTPMWNAKLSEKMWQGYVQNANAADIAYASPMEAECFDGLSAAYVETAEFDCLHDEGVAYAQAMQKAGIDVVLNETKGTMHGFDIVEKAPTTQAAVAARIGFMKERFNKAINKKSEV